MRTFTIAVLASLLASAPAAASTESDCNDTITKAFAGLRNAEVKSANGCVTPGFDCAGPEFRVAVKRDDLRAKVTGPNSPCTAAVNADAVPVAAFGPGATCPARYTFADGGEPIATLDDLADCLIQIADGHSTRALTVLGVPDVVWLPAAHKNEQRCARLTFKPLAKTWKAGISQVSKCTRGATKPFVCTLDSSPESNLGRTLARVERMVAKCSDAAGVVGAFSGESAKLCNRHLGDPGDLAACVREAAMCLVCRDANALYELGEDCAAFAGSRTCEGARRDVEEGAAFVTNAGDDTITRFASGLAYAEGTLGTSSTAVGDHPAAVALHVGSNTVFSANRDDDSVTLLVASTGAYANGSALASTVPVGEEPVDLDVNTDNDILYVLNRADETVTFLDVHDGEPAFGNLASSTFTVGASPTAVRYVPGAVIDDVPATLLVANGGDDSITVLDPVTGAYFYGTFAASTFPTVTAPTSISAHVGGLTVFVDRIVAVGSAAGEAIAYHEAGTGLPVWGTLAGSTVPAGMPVTAIAGLADALPFASYVQGSIGFDGLNLLSATDDLLLSVRKAVRRAEGPIATGTTPVAADTLPFETSIYVVEQGLDRVAVYTPGDSAALSSVDTGPQDNEFFEEWTDRIAVNTANDTVYVVTCGDLNHTVRYLDAATGAYKLGSQAASTFAVPGCAANVAVSPSLNRVYVASMGSDVVTYLDATTGAYIGGSLAAASISVDADPGPMVVNEADGILYVANRAAKTVTYLDASTPAFLGPDLAGSSIATPLFAWGLEVYPAAATLYVAQADAGGNTTGDVLYLDALSPAYKFGTAGASQMAAGSPAFAVAVNTATDTLFVGRAGSIDYLDATTGAVLPGVSSGGAAQFAVDASSGIAYAGYRPLVSLLHFDTTAGPLTGHIETSRIASSGLDDLAIHPGLGLLYGTEMPLAFGLAGNGRVYFWNAARMSLAFPDVSVTQTAATGPTPTDIVLAR